MRSKVVNSPPLFRGGLFLFLFILTVSMVSAEECGILNIGECLEDLFIDAIAGVPNLLFEFLIDVLNAPVVILLDIIKSLLTEPVKISVFAEPWAIIIYMLSFFYG